MTTTTSDAGQKLRENVRGAIRSQKQPTETVLSALLAVQDAIRYLPDVAIEEVAEYSRSTVNEVWSVASYYTNFRFTPPGDTTLDICWGPTCHLMGAQNILRKVQETLGIDEEVTTANGKVTLRYNTCLGACAQAPVIAVDHHLIGRVTPESAAETAANLSQ